ncbi:MAG: hypothetical protein ACLGSA_01195 [Acidobacteriota bacterium]
MEKARFMGRMAATLSHDLCNVLATIQQASGLLGDYLALARKESLKSMGLRPKFKYNDKFEEIIAQVQASVARGQDMCEHLSHLAHSPDEGQDGSDLNFSVRLLVQLSGRIAKKHKLTLEIGQAPAAVLAEPSQIEVLVVLEAALLGVTWRCREQGSVRLVPGEDGDRAYVDILCQALDAGEAQSLAKSLTGDKPGLLAAEALEGGVRLAFRKAGREA